MNAERNGHSKEIVADYWRRAARFWSMALDLRELDEDMRDEIAQHMLRAISFAKRAERELRRKIIVDHIIKMRGGRELVALGRCVDDTIGVAVRRRIGPILDFPLRRK